MVIAQMTLMEIASYFLIYSFLGWVLEVVYQALAKGLVVNRGFLNGPVCPIYGFGMVGIFLLMQSISDQEIQDMNFGAVFLCGILLASGIELFGGWILDKCFHARWWDYRSKPFNFHGYICLEFSIIWGLGIVFVVREVQPFLHHLIRPILQHSFILPVLLILYAAYLADFVLSVFIMIGLNKQFAELDELRGRMRVASDELSQRIGSSALETAQRIDNAKLQTALAKAEFQQLTEMDSAELEQELNRMRESWEERKTQFNDKFKRRKHFGFGRILRAFPQLDPHRHEELLRDIRDALKLD